MAENMFERYAGEYDCWFEEHLQEYQQEVARIRCLLPHPGPCALEVGVGSSRFAAPLGIRFGVDPSRELLKIAKSRSTEVVRGEGEHLPYRSGSFDYVLMVTVICFLDDPAAAFREIHRVLIPQGALVIGFIERRGDIAQNYLHDEGKHRFLSRAQFYSRDEVQGLLGHTGFRVADVDPRAGFCVIAARKSG